MKTPLSFLAGAQMLGIGTCPRRWANDSSGCSGLNRGSYSCGTAPDLHRTSPGIDKDALLMGINFSGVANAFLLFFVS